jgi:hypothetical protein
VFGRIVTVGSFGWEIAHEAVSRRPPISLDTIVARTHMYTYAANVWGLSTVQGAFLLPPRAEPSRYDSQLFHRGDVCVFGCTCSRRSAMRCDTAVPSTRSITRM